MIEAAVGQWVFRLNPGLWFRRQRPRQWRKGSMFVSEQYLNGGRMSASGESSWSVNDCTAVPCDWVCCEETHTM